MKSFSIPLYHGTSTLFLTSILQNGLSGRNVIRDFKVIEFANEILPIAQKHLTNENWQNKIYCYSLMAQQKNTSPRLGSWAHGSTYVTASKDNAVKYAIHQRYGSEILTYSLDILQELLSLNIKGLRDVFYKKYPAIYHTLDVPATPILVTINGIPEEFLKTEIGGDANDMISDAKKEFAKSKNGAWKIYSQMFRFRIIAPISANKLKISLIIRSTGYLLCPEDHYDLYPITI